MVPFSEPGVWNRACHKARLGVKSTIGMDITLRPITPEDDEVLFALFCSAHRHKFAPLGLPDAHLEPLLRMQFEGQRQDFARNYPDADFNLVLKAGVVVGQWFVCRRPEHIVVIDVTFLPASRTGMATRLVRNLLREARETGQPVRAHVETTNPARKLWLRLGLRRVGGDEAYWRLEYPGDSEG